MIVSLIDIDTKVILILMYIRSCTLYLGLVEVQLG